MSIVSFEVFRTPFGFFGRWNCPRCGGEQIRVFTLQYEYANWPGFMEGVPVGISHYCTKCGHYHHPEFFFKGKNGWTQIPLEGPIRGGEYIVEAEG